MLIFRGVCAIANGINSCQCFGRVSSPAASSLFYSGVAGSGVINPKIGNPGGQVRISFSVRSARPGVSLSMPKIKEVMAKTLRWASRSSTTAYSPGLLNPFFTSARFAGSMDSIPMKIHLAHEAAIRSTSSSSRSRFALIWATQCTCAFAAMMSRSSDFVRFTLIAKLSSMKNTAICPPSSRARAFIGPKANGVAKKSRHGAELTTVRTTPPGFHWNNSKSAPAFAYPLQQRLQHARQHIELLQIDFVPGNFRIRLQGRFAFLPKIVHWRIDILQRPAHGIFHDSRPGLVSFAKCNGVGMPRAAVTPQSLIRHFRDVRAAHHHLYSRGPHCIRHAIGLGDHPGHRADADEFNPMLAHVPRDTLFIHGLGVSVNQDYFVAGWGERSEEKHPRMRHKIASYAVVGVVQQNFHLGGISNLGPGVERLSNFAWWLRVYTYSRKLRKRSLSHQASANCSILNTSDLRVIIPQAS